MATTLKGIQANTETLTKTFDESKGVVSYELTRNYVVDSDTPYPSKTTILSTAGLPKIGYNLAIESTFLRMVSADINELSDKCFIVRATFRNNTRVPAEGEEEQPELLPVEISMGSTTIQTSPMLDPKTGHPVRNSAGDPLGITQDITLPTYQMVKYYRYFDIDVIRNYVNKVNNKTFFGARPNEALCKDINATLIQKDRGTNSYLWKVTYSFVFRVIGADELAGADHYRYDNGAGDDDPSNPANYVSITPVGWMVGRLNTGTKFKDFVAPLGTKIDVPFEAGEGPLKLEGDRWEPSDGNPIFLWYNSYESANCDKLELLE